MNPGELQSVLERHGQWLKDDLSGERATLRGETLHIARLGRADLSKADFSGADLEGADLTCADLSDANLEDANLSGARLDRATLRGANLEGANLSGADLEGADLTRADLSYANFYNAALHRVRLAGAKIANAVGNGHEIKSAQIGFYMITYTATDLAIGDVQRPIEAWLDVDADCIGNGVDAFYINNRAFIEMMLERFPATPGKGDV